MAFTKTHAWIVAALGVLAAGFAFELVVRKFRPVPPPVKSVRLTSAALPEVHLAPRNIAPPIASNVTLAERSIRFSLRLPAKGGVPSLSQPLIFCIPPSRTIRPVVTSYRIGGEAISIPEADSEPTTQSLETKKQIESGIEFAIQGILRRWTLGSIKLNHPFFAPYSDTTTPRKGDLEAEIALEWDDPIELASASNSSRDLTSELGWGGVMNRLTSNPDHLPIFQIADPPLKSGVNPKATAPWVADSWPTDHPARSEDMSKRRWARLRLTGEGLYHIRTEDLWGFGDLHETRLEDLRLFYRGEPIPLLRQNEGETKSVHFWHNHSESKYSRESVYWVTLAPEWPDPQIEPLKLDPAALEIRPVPFVPRRSEINRDNLIKVESGNFLAIHKMEWVDAPIRSDPSLALPLDMRGYIPMQPTLRAKMRLYFEVTTEIPRFKLDLKLGDQVVATALVRSREDFEPTLEIPSSLVNEGINDFSLVTGNLDEVATGDALTTAWLDSISLDFGSRPTLVDGALTLADGLTTPPHPTTAPRWTILDDAQLSTFSQCVAISFDSKGHPTASLKPIERQGMKGYLWPGEPGVRVEIRAASAIGNIPKFEVAETVNLAKDDLAADQLIITHREFLEQAQRLAELHHKQGGDIRIVDIQSVFDNFSYGELTPEAIRDFLAYTLGHWKQGAPSRVLFVGDCTSDYLGQTRSAVKNWVPSYTYESGMDDWASDYWMGVVAGEDDLSDFMIGRLSVANVEDARAIVDKIIAYSENPKPGPWRARIGFVADDGGFIEPMEELRRDHTPPAYDPRRIYLDAKMPLEDNTYLPSRIVAEKKLKVSPVASSRIRDAFNNGAAYLTYYGHGSPNIWMEERVWFGGNSTNSDNQYLADSGFASFVTTMTCNTGAIDYPMPKGMPGGGWNLCISEDMMRVKNGGAIALYVPSGPSVTGIQHTMSIEMHRAMFGEGVRSLGEIVALSASRFICSGQAKELPYMLILLGDPAMRLQMAEATGTFTLPRTAMEPGDTLEFALAGISPESGEFSAVLGSEAKGHEAETIWETRGETFTNGRIPIRLKLPVDAHIGSTRLRVYAWDAVGGECLADAPLEIARPNPSITSARIEKIESNPTELVVTVSNSGSLEAKGCKLEIARIADGQQQGATEQALSLAAGTTQTLRVPLRLVNEKGDDAALAQVRLVTPHPPPDDAPAASRERKVTVIPEFKGNGEPWIGFVAEMGAWRQAADRHTAHLDAAIGFSAAAIKSLEGKSLRWAVDLVTASGEPIVRAEFAPAEGVVTVPLDLVAAQLERTTSATLSLVTYAAEATTPTVLNQITLSSIPREDFRLRIREDRIRVEPENPFEGQTILLRCEIENSGDMESPPFNVSLYDKPPAMGGQLLPNYILGNAQVASGPLAADRTREVLARWDPFDNAGEKSVVVRLEPQRGNGASTEADLMVEKKIHVRKKANLVRGATKREDAALIGELANQGETEAQNVLVVFYRSAVKTPENEVGRVLVPIVRGGESLRVRLDLTPEKIKFAEAAEKGSAPVHEFRLNPLRRGMAPVAPLSAPPQAKTNGR